MASRAIFLQEIRPHPSEETHVLVRLAFYVSQQSALADWLASVGRQQCMILPVPVLNSAEVNGSQW